MHTLVLLATLALAHPAADAGRQALGPDPGPDVPLTSAEPAAAWRPAHPPAAAGDDGAVEGTAAAPVDAGARQEERDHVYRTWTLRAAPGRLLELIDFLKAWRGILVEAGDEPFEIMRHSQGDHWDLMVLQYFGDMAHVTDTDRRDRIERIAREAGWTPARLQRTRDALIAWQEDLFVDGPPLDVVREGFSGAGYFHIEMFQALPGKRAELRHQRRIENDYLVGIGREANLIFTRIMGSPVDLYTLGFYRDVAHFAQGSDLPAEERDRIAREAGFEGADRIGTYLRELIARHHDTLATAVR